MIERRRYIYPGTVKVVEERFETVLDDQYKPVQKSIGWFVVTDDLRVFGLGPEKPDFAAPTEAKVILEVELNAKPGQSPVG